MPQPKNKKCCQCSVTKATTQFYANRAATDQLTPACKTCYRARVDKWQTENPAKVLNTARSWYHRNRDRALANGKRWRAENPRRVRHMALLARFGITYDDYIAMATAQNWLCAICQTLMDPPCVDHDHQTGRMRGLLCRQCNLAIGNFKEQIANVIAAVSYLRHYEQT